MCKMQPGPHGCCVHMHRPGTSSIPTPGDWSLLGGTCGNTGSQHGGRQRGILKEPVTAALTFPPSRCLRALGRGNAPCQALEATALPAGARELAGSTSSRGRVGWHCTPSPQHFPPPACPSCEGGPVLSRLLLFQQCLTMRVPTSENTAGGLPCRESWAKGWSEM